MRTAGLRPALLGWLWARVCIAAGFVVAHLLSGHVGMPDGRLHLHQGLLTWDGTFYRALASGWYGGTPAEGARFFPLYPGLGRVLAPVFLGREDVALVVLANACALAGAIVLWHLAREVVDRDGAAGVAGRSAWIVAIVPSAFVLAFAYGESLALLLVALTLLLAHRRWWWWAALTGLAAGLVRPVGVLVAVPVAIEAWTALRPRVGRWSARELLGGLAAVAGPVAGLALGILWIGATTGDLGEPLRIQRQLRAGFRDPVTRLAEGLWDVARFDLRDVYNVAFAVLFIVLLVLSWRRRQPWSWLAYSAVTLVVGLSANNIDSLGRYGLLALPLVVALAQWAAPRWRQALVAAAGSAGLVWMTAAALLGRMIP